MREKGWARLLRILGIVLMGLTALFTLMGGAGTSCVALNPTGYEGKFAGIAPFQWLYLLFVVVTLAIGAMGVRAVVQLVRGAKTAYRNSLTALGAGTAIGVLHMAVSRSLRGGSMPVDMVVYTTVVTLIVFLLFRLPGVWQAVNFEKPDGGGRGGLQAAAFASGACGMLALSIQFLMEPTHTIGGVNYADVWHLSMTAVGLALIGGGVVSFLRQVPRSRRIAVDPLTDPVR